MHENNLAISVLLRPYTAFTVLTACEHVWSSVLCLLKLKCKQIYFVTPNMSRINITPMNRRLQHAAKELSSWLMAKAHLATIIAQTPMYVVPGINTPEELGHTV